MIISVMMITFVLHIYLTMKPLQNIIMELMMKVVMCMVALLPVLHIMMIIWNISALWNFFMKNISMKKRTSIYWSMIQATKTPLCSTKMLMRIPGHSWKIQSITSLRRKLMNHKILMVLLIVLSMAYRMEVVLILLMVLLNILFIRF